MKWGIALAVLVVLALHQDFWFWKDKTLVFGFLPMGLAYQMGFSILASFTMAWLVRSLWPVHLEELEGAGVTAGEGRP